MEPIPLSRPLVPPTAAAYVAEALGRAHLAGDGPFTRRCQDWLERHLGAARVLLTTSCTDALEMTALLLDLGPGDEVLVPAFTFVSTANAFVLRGVRPVFVDVRPDTLNLDERLLPGLITPRTKAIVLVHYAGVACALDAVLPLAARHGLAVIEDNAHGLFGGYRGRPLGTFGGLATLSFHDTKNVSCGEGGALVVNDAAYAERAEVLRHTGTNRRQFLLGQVDKYTWVDVGSSFLLSDVLAAVLWAQLEATAEIQARRRRLWHRYAAALADWAGHHGVQLPQVPADCDQPYHLFHLVLPSPAGRRALMEHLRGQGIVSSFHYQPLHLSAMGRRLGGRAGDCPVTESVSERLLRLPFYTELSDDAQARVIDAVQAFRGVA